MSPNCDAEEHLAVAPCLWKKVNASGLQLPAHLWPRLHTAGKQEGHVPGLWKLDS